MTEPLASKYDRIADDFAAGTYANVRFDMERRLHLATCWGAPLKRGDSVLELGCGDGYLAELFVRGGFRYSGTDLSPRMVEITRARLRTLGFAADVTEADIRELELRQDYDSIVSFMGTFFSYVADPVSVLRRLRPHVTKKIILDVNPRIVTLSRAIAALESAGFRHVKWRPFFVPVTVRLPAPVLRLMTLAELVPLLRGIPLRWKFICMLRGLP